MIPAPGPRKGPGGLFHPPKGKHHGPVEINGGDMWEEYLHILTNSKHMKSTFDKFQACHSFPTNMDLAHAIVHLKWEADNNACLLEYQRSICWAYEAICRQPFQAHIARQALATLRGELTIVLTENPYREHMPPWAYKLACNMDHWLCFEGEAEEYVVAQIEALELSGNYDPDEPETESQQ